MLAELLERCLAKNPQHRPRASEVAKTLERVGEDPRAVGAPAGLDSSTGQAFSHAVENIPAVGAFIGELRRRHVFKVAVYYTLLAAGIVGVAEATLDSLPLPDNSMDILVAVTLGGFPVILVLSWMFDISTKGIQRTESEVSGPALTKQYILQALGLILSLTLAGFLGWWVLSATS